MFLGMDFLHFLNPVKLGELVVIKAQVTRAFTSSMEVGVQVRGENPIVSFNLPIIVHRY